MLVSVLWMSTLVGVCLARCDRSPEGNPYPRTSGNDRFHILISGNPETYVPGEQYTVFLRGTMTPQEQHKFKDFLLVIEPEQQQLAGHLEGRAPGPNAQVGHFTLLGDALTKFSDLCPNAVSQTNSLPKTEIQVFWKAPPAGSGCVAFRATVIEQRDMWYMDEGDLTRILCEEITESDDSQPQVLSKCCACDEAKYEVTFEGLWSRNTHPKDFPSNGWLTRFSDVIGASHTKNYTFWNYGEFASEGLRQVAENGNTRMLESELKGKSDHIRTIIKARGISYPNVTGKTFAVFRVDNQHHLMSLVSMIDPSPDWFVGVSSLELCLRNCSWIESKVLNLYPWDAGTDDGWTYISPDSPSTPRSPIRRIKSNSPNDPRSPFYDATGTEMKPLARLYLSRQRLYEKPCDDVDIGEPPDQPDDCDVEEWSDWSHCSATCGKGYKYRQRNYVRESSKYVCTKHLTSRATCYGPQRNCPNPNEDPVDDPRCGLTDWSEWSSCSVTCGKGSRTRDRRYHTRNATKHCSLGRNPPKTKDTDYCEGVFGRCEGEDNEENNSEVRDCPDRPWSDWSPCSVTCGNGYKTRTRDPVNTETDYDDETTNENDDEENDPCEDERDKETVQCQAEIPTCDITFSSAEDICRMPKDIGPCRANIQRWFFDHVRAKCESFSFSGCQGNRNNFQTKEYCEKVCGHFRKELIANRTVKKKELGVSVSGVLNYNLQLQDDANLGADCATPDPINDYQIGPFIADSHLNDPNTRYDTIAPVVDCRTTRWTSWTSCNATEPCTKGVKKKHRDIVIHPMNGGKACPKRLIKFRRCKIACRGNKDDLDPTWGPPGGSEGQVQDCLMSKWSAWTPCNVSCGQGIQQRTRKILRHPRGGGKTCLSRIDSRDCHVFPCPYV